MQLSLMYRLFNTDSKLRLDVLFPHSVRSNHTVCFPTDRTASLVMKTYFLPHQFPPSQFSRLSLPDTRRHTHSHAHTHACAHIHCVTSDGCSPLMRMSSSRHLQESWRCVWRNYLSNVNMAVMGDLWFPADWSWKVVCFLLSDRMHQCD